MYTPSFSPIRRRQHKPIHQQTSEMVSPMHSLSSMPFRRHGPIISPQMSGDYHFLRKQVDEHRLALRNCRSELASALDRLGEHHVKCKEYDDAMDAFTEALHEKRSVHAYVAPSLDCSCSSRSRANSDEAQIDLERETQLNHDETIEAIVQTLRNMGNVHSLRGEQDEAMRYYTEVTNLRANRASARDARSVESFSKSSYFGTDEDTSTLMSELNEDVKALDDLFRSISFRNTETPKKDSSQSVSQSSSTKSSDSPRKRRRGDGLRENGSSENEPFKRSSSLGTRSNNELTEALDSYRNCIDTLCVDQEFHEERIQCYLI